MCVNCYIFRFASVQKSCVIVLVTKKEKREWYPLVSLQSPGSYIIIFHLVSLKSCRHHCLCLSMRVWFPRVPSYWVGYVQVCAHVGDCYWCSFDSFIPTYFGQVQWSKLNEHYCVTSTVWTVEQNDMWSPLQTWTGHHMLVLMFPDSQCSLLRETIELCCSSGIETFRSGSRWCYCYSSQPSLR